MTELIACTPKLLADECRNDAALAAMNENPLNAPHVPGLVLLNGKASPDSIAMVTSKYWRTNGVRLTVGFLDSPEQALRDRILLHMNAWSLTGNVQFVESATDPQVRISRSEPGYWSYIGTDILLIDADKPTLNLQDFTMATPDSEFHRVVRHETGHTLGCPHEHMRADLISLIDPQKAIDYFGATQGWSPDQVRAQVLTPIETVSVLGTPVDQLSIMCYHIPGQLTKDGNPILGGLDIDQSDYDFVGKIYPKPSPLLAGTASAAAFAPTDVAVEDERGRHQHRRHEDCSVRIDLASGNRMSIHRPLSPAEIESLADRLRH